MKEKISFSDIDENYKIVIYKVKEVIKSLISYPFTLTIYGSVARAEETLESDLDLLLLIDGPVGFQLKQNIWQSLYPIELEEDTVISLFVESKQTWETKYATLSLLYSNIEQEGIHVG